MLHSVLVGATVVAIVHRSGDSEISMSGTPDTKFVDGGGGFVAYQEVGHGPPDIVYVPSWGDSLEGIWDSPAAEKFLRRLTSLGRLILFDKRGTGVSDPLQNPYNMGSGDFALVTEEAAADLLAVVDHLGVDRAALVAPMAGGNIALMFAATYPGRTEAMVLIDPVPRLVAGPDYPWGISSATRDYVARMVRESWGTGFTLAALVPSLAHDPTFVAWAARYERVACARGVMASQWESLSPDFRPLLASIQCPTLVMHHVGHPFYDSGAALYAVSQIPGAVGSVEIPTSDLQIYGPQPDLVLDAIDSFLTAQSTSERVVRDIDRVFAVVAFTDLVDSTKTAADVGDQRWRELLDVHESVAARQVSAHRGRLVKHTGDGMLATFDAPARAIRCMQAMSAELGQIGVKMRSGVHAGEIELRGDDIGGLAVHIGARVMAQAASAEVLVSRTVTDLVAGSGITFSDRGEYELKGVPGTWRLFAVEG